MKPFDLRFRQVHLDFHTSEAIEGIAANFDPDEFAETLKNAHVNSVTCFARCHHGWMYYDTRLFPERVHPHLRRRNLLKEQIEACHARDIRVPIYITVQWDHYTASQHPEWLVLGADGRITGTPPYEAGFYRYLCVNSPYVDFLKAHTQEVLESLPVDGIFFDIVQPQDCSCRFCRQAMEAEDLDPADDQARRAFGLRVINRFKQDMTAFVRRFNASCSIFYNAGHIGPRHRGAVSAYTHFELESLPSGGWGYVHFPLTMRYARTLGIDCLGMTGKFHTSWGDFHSFKNLSALQYEVFQMLALGAKCSIGDQLHPDGRLSPPVYDLIGSVYAEVEQKEPWCIKAQPVTEVGVFSPEEFHGGGIGRLPPPLVGAVRMLSEGSVQFDILDSHSDFERYKVLILPDIIPLDETLATRLQRYLHQGGGLIASYRSGLDPSGTVFALPEWGVQLKGDAPYSPDFLLPSDEIGKGLPSTEHVVYLRGLEVAARAGSAVLAQTVVPYFNRTYRHFCSHRHTPSSGNVGYPGIVRAGNLIYFAHPIFTQYHDNAPRWCRTLLLNALEMLNPEPLLRHDGPSTLLATINEQQDMARWVVHLLHYIPERRGQAFDTIEDVIPLHSVTLSLRTPRKVKAVRLAPRGEALSFSEKDGRLEFTVPCVTGHQMVEVKF